MLSLYSYERIQTSLQEVSALVDRHAGGEEQFPRHVEKWLKEVEALLTSAKAVHSARIASMRASLLSADKGIIPPSLQIKATLGRSRRKHAVALAILQQATDVVFDFIQNHHQRFSEAERIMAQLVALAKAKGLLSEMRRDRAEPLALYWQKLSQEKEIATGVVSLEGLVGSADALIMFDRACLGAGLNAG